MTARKNQKNTKLEIYLGFQRTEKKKKKKERAPISFFLTPFFSLSPP